MPGLGLVSLCHPKLVFQIGPPRVRPAVGTRDPSGGAGVNPTIQRLVALAQLLPFELRESGTLRTTGGMVERRMPPFLTRARVDALVRMMLGGRAAEAVVFDEASSGAGGGEESDLAMASQLLIDAEIRLGLGETLTWQSPDITARLLAQGSRIRIEDALRTAEIETREALTRHRAELDRIAKALLDKRELTAKDLTDLLDPVSPNKAMDIPDTGHADQLTMQTPPGT